MVANSKASAVMSHKLDAEHTENALVIEQVAEGETTLWTSIKENPRAIMLAFLANCGSVLFGYDILIRGAITALPMFSIAFGSPFGDDIILPALWQGVWQGFNAIGIMIGAASNGVVMGTALFDVSSNVGGLDSRRGVLLAGKLVIGLGMGIFMSTCQTYVSEISPPRLRTVLLAGSYSFVFQTVGHMMAISVVFWSPDIFSRVAVMDYSALKILFASQWAFSSSPQTTPHGEAATFADCSKGTDLRRTRIVAVLNTLQQLTGVSLIANSTYFFIMAGMSPTMSLTINQAGVGASVACTLISWFIGVALVMAACCSNLGTGTAYPIVAAEIPATRLRAKTLGSGFAVNAFMMWAFKFVVPYMFNADQGNLGGTIGPVFAGFCVVGFVDSFFEIPETKDITYSRINALFQTRTPARGFRAMAVSYEAENMAGTGDA
ncbi:maltose permease MAL61 [Verticillium dahliae]|nr:maltose permease MAL61 [Verticillium dahliae]